MKKLVRILLFLLVSPVILLVLVLATGGIITGVLYAWSTDAEDVFGIFMFMLFGEVLWLGIPLIICNL